MSKLGAFAIAIFYFLIVSLSIIMLATVQIRASGGEAFDTWRRNYISNINYKLNAKEALEFDKKATELREKLSNYQSSLVIAHKCIDIVFDKLGKPLVHATDKEMQDAKNKYNADNWIQIPGDIGCLVRSYKLILGDIEYFRGQADWYKEQYERLKAEQKSNDALFQDLKKERGEFLAIIDMEAIPYWGKLLILPYDLLVLFLVVLMGALGGMVRLLRDYGAAGVPNPSPNAYFYIPLIGGVVAIGGFGARKIRVTVTVFRKDRSIAQPLHNKSSRDYFRSFSTRSHRRYPREGR